MKKYYSLALIVVLMTACIPGAATVAPHRPSPMPTSAEQTTMPTVTATTDVMPSPVPPTSTATLTPTLTASEREARVVEWLETNAGCELPCWWGVVPGATTWRETQRLLQSVGARTLPEKKPDGTVVHGTGGFDFDERSIYNGVSFIERAGVIDAIHLHAESPLNPDGFQTAWMRYSPHNLMRRYGKPSRVLVKSAYSVPTDPADPRVGYSLWLIYDHLGFLIGYEGVVAYEPVYHICPRFDGGEDIARIEAYLQSPAGELPLNEAIESYRLFPRYFRTLEVVSGLSIDEFYALFAQTETPACFDAPGDNWP